MRFAMVTVLALLALATASEPASAQRGRARGRGRTRTTATTTTSADAADAGTATTSTDEVQPNPFDETAATGTGSGSGTGTGTGSGSGSSGTGTGTQAARAQADTSSASSSSSSSSSSTSSSAGDPGPLPPDLAPLRTEYVAIMDEMVQARQRVAVLGEELFHTRLSVDVQDRTGDDQSMVRFALELDGAPIHQSDGELEGGEAGRRVFEGALAPGPHVLTLVVEQTARDDAEYRTTQRESFRFVVVRDRRTEVTIVLEEGSDIARSFRGGGEGSFDLRTRLRVATRALEGS